MYQLVCYVTGIKYIISNKIVMLILKCRIRFILQCFVLFPQRFESWLLFFMNYFIASSNIQLYYQTNLSPNNSVDHSSVEKLHVYFSCCLISDINGVVGFCQSHFYFRWSFITLFDILRCQTFLTTNSSINNSNIKSLIQISIYFTFHT